MEDEPRIAAWNAKVDWPLTGLAVAFLGLYAWQVLDTGLGPEAREAVDLVLTGIWVLFGLDYLVRITLARNRRRFVGGHLLDLAFLLLPMIRPLRALRVITVISVLNRQLRDDARGRIAIYVGATVALVAFVAALAVLEAERNAPDASITTFGEALWWTITTLSTVGYGDRYPVTVEGRLVAATLMVAGIALLGVVTASIAAWFVENLRRAQDEVSEEVEEVSADVEATQVQLADVLAELRTISARLDALERDRRGGTTTPDPDRSAPSVRPSAWGRPDRSDPAQR
jgi:voltage-gated potassium channel